ncbi:MAG: hypothetical protein L0H31_01495 [Nocardioidaceae bacterium]|nr:hypothetical protein [Nocardioidaceae bacterium]
MDSPTAGRTALDRWRLSGGHWAVVAERGDQVTVGLFTCDGGQEMERVTLPISELPDQP